ncbi:MAG TPA: aldo/keto reductase [Actinoplanes sp.]|jgi:aryl-alcohol dehydrogenase-like predicted oxidoreductase
MPGAEQALWAHGRMRTAPAAVIPDRAGHGWTVVNTGTGLANVAGMISHLLADLPRFIYGTTRLGHHDVPRDRQLAMAHAALDAGLWMHTSRQYDHALEVLGAAFAERPDDVPPLIVKLGGGTADDVRATVMENVGPLGIDHIAIGQLTPAGALADDMVAGGPVLADLRRLRDEGLVGRYVMEIFPWTSAAPLEALRAGHLDGLVDGVIMYLNPLQRFASNPLWDEIMEREISIVSMRTVSGGSVYALRDVPGAAWRPYLQQRAVEVAPIFERSGVTDWTEFCVRFAHSVPHVVSTVGSTSRPDHLQALLAASAAPRPLPRDIVDEVLALHRRWSAEVDVHAEPWTM